MKVIEEQKKEQHQQQLQGERNHYIIKKFLKQTLSNDKLTYADLNLLLSLLAQKNPSYKVQSFQYIEEQSKQDYIMLKVEDQDTQKTYSLKVFSREGNYRDKFEDIINLYKGYQYLLRNDLIIEIHDLYFLEQYDDPFFLVIEMELIDTTLTVIFNQCDNFMKKEIKKLTSLSLNYLDDSTVIKKTKNIENSSFYVKKLNDGQIRIKLNVLDSSSFSYQKSSSKDVKKSSQERNFISQKFQYFKYTETVNKFVYEEINAQKYSPEEISSVNKNDVSFDEEEEQANFLEIDFNNYMKSLGLLGDYSIKQQLREIKDNNQISINTFLQYLKINKPQMLETHPEDVFEMIIAHPKYQKISLVEAGPNYFIIKVFDQKKQYLLKCQQFKTLLEAERMSKLYDKYIKTAGDIFKQIKNVELFIGEESFYLMVEEDIQAQISLTKIQCSNLITCKDLILQGILMYLLLKKTILRIQSLSLFQTDISNWRVVADSQKNPQFILLENPLFLNEKALNQNDCISLYQQKNRELQLDLSSIHECLTRTISTFQLDGLDKLINLSQYHRLIKNKHYQTIQTLFEQRLSVANRFNNILKNNDMNQRYSEDRLKITNDLLISLQIYHSDLIKYLQTECIQDIDELLIFEKYSVFNLVDLEYIEEFKFVQYPQLKSLRIEFKHTVFTPRLCRGVKYLFTLFPNLQKLDILISNKLDNNVSQNIPSVGESIYFFTKLNTLEIQLLNVPINYLQRERNLLCQSLQQIKTVKNLNFKFIVSNKVEQELQTQLSLLYKLNADAQEYGSSLAIKYGFDKKFQQLKQNLKTFFFHDQIKYGLYLSTLSLFIHHFQVQVMSKLSDNSKQMSIIISKKQDNFFDLTIKLSKNFNHEIIMVISSEMKQLGCQSQGVMIDLQTALRLWYESSVYSKTVAFSQGNSMNYYCKHSTNNKYQIDIASHSKTLTTLSLTLECCTQTLLDLEEDHNYFQFSKLPNLRGLTLYISVQNDMWIIRRFYTLVARHLKQLDNLTCLDFRNDKSLTKQKKYFCKLKRLVTLKIL